MKRRTFLKRSFAGLAGLGLIGGVYAWQIEPFRLEFVKLKLGLRNLPLSLVGKTLMQISDIHVGKGFDHNFIINSFEEAQRFNPDFVVYTGDYVSTFKDEVQFDLLRDVLVHTVLGKLGTVAILGNHDYGKNWSQPHVADRLSKELESQDIIVLRNEQLNIHGLNFIGFDDYWGPNFDLPSAIQGYQDHPCNLALCHNPDVCDLNVWEKFNGWILSGHTHGGQVKPPFLPPPMLPVKNKRYSAGKVDLDANRTLYINRALGHLWQIRFNGRPEITIFELHQI